jgi:hypothetical protein
MAIDNFNSPSLPMPPKDYSFEYFNQLVRSISSYFRILDSKAAVNYTGLTTEYVRIPMYDYEVRSSLLDNVSLPISSFIRVSAASGNFTLTGIGNGSDGRTLTLFNSTTVTMTVANDDSRSSPLNRILTCTGANIVLTGQSVVNLIYSIKDSRWIVTSTQG